MAVWRCATPNRGTPAGTRSSTMRLSRLYKRHDEEPQRQWEKIITDDVQKMQRDEITSFYCKLLRYSIIYSVSGFDKWFWKPVKIWDYLIQFRLWPLVSTCAFTAQVHVNTLTDINRLGSKTEWILRCQALWKLLGNSRTLIFVKKKIDLTFLSKIVERILGDAWCSQFVSVLFLLSRKGIKQVET